MMVTLNRIYTRTGDSGETSLGDGSRTPKFALRVATYGTVDETNAAFGLARAAARAASADLEQAIASIQNDLFDLGADLCLPEDASGPPPLRVSGDQILRLEQEIDVMNKVLHPLRSFVLPGGSDLAAHLHLCRTVARRAERLCVELASQEPVGENALKYLNRLSDWCFVAARAANENGKTDILWVPGKNR